MNKQALTNLLAGEEREESYSVRELFADLNQSLWKIGSRNEQTAGNRRQIEKAYVSALCRLYKERDLKNNGGQNAVLLVPLKHLQKIISGKQHSGNDLQAANIAYMQTMIAKTFDNN